MSLAENSLGRQLQEYRIRRGLSQTAVAQQIGVTPSTINRFETGARAPGREALLAIGRALAIDRTDLDRLLRAAGELPLDLIEVGLDDPDLRLCLSILADPTIPSTEKHDFRWQIRLAARRWRPAPPDAGSPAHPSGGGAIGAGLPGSTESGGASSPFGASPAIRPATVFGAPDPTRFPPGAPAGPTAEGVPSVAARPDALPAGGARA